VLALLVRLWPALEASASLAGLGDSQASLRAEAAHAARALLLALCAMCEDSRQEERGAAFGELARLVSRLGQLGSAAGGAPALLGSADERRWVLEQLLYPTLRRLAHMLQPADPLRVRGFALGAAVSACVLFGGRSD
jgi:hypothetical protein